MKLWKYQHFKWMFVNVIWIAKHSETLEEMVVYEHPDPVKWFEWGILRTRPKNMFEEKVMVDGKEVPRFKYIWE